MCAIQVYHWPVAGLNRKKQSVVATQRRLLSNNSHWHIPFWRRGQTTDSRRFLRQRSSSARSRRQRLCTGRRVEFPWRRFAHISTPEARPEGRGRVSERRASLRRRFAGDATHVVVKRESVPLRFASQF